VSATAPRGILVVDKEAGPTSHDVVSRARKALGTRAVGHAGTLDPMATGVLVLGVGEGTKLLGHLGGDDKVYETELRLGVATVSLDADGEITGTAPVPGDLDVARVAEVARRFVGTIAQRAPAVSAIKVGGKALHARVRAGEDVEAPVREVVCRAIDVTRVADGVVTFRVECGKGFYVRSLGRDLAEALGTVGHLTALRRMRSGAFDVARALPYGRLVAAAKGDEAARADVRAALRTLEDAWTGKPRAVLDAAGVEDARHGRRIAVERVVGPTPPTGTCAGAFDGAGVLIALVDIAADGIRVARGIVTP
jgi:tRNA pseudouridine55 synthase